ncbi:MAG TPA: hypothetical protein VLL05_01765 [Terriglobales bacterium]|nr:hypothetical protein [Terriglobales bacterium]
MRVPLLVFSVCALGLISVVWFQPSYAAPLAAAYFVLLVQAMRHLRHAGILGRPIGVFLTRLLVFLAIDWVVIQGVHAVRHHVRGWNVSRVDVSATLAALPGQHLVLVRYSPSHDAHHEWVYNAADIDHARIVWAREIPGQDLQPLLNYFKDRKIWLLEPDNSPPELRPYPPSR